MTHELIIRIQVDRLPDVPTQSATDLVQIGLRASAIIRATDGSALPRPDQGRLSDDLLPWMWRSLPAITAPPPDGPVTPGNIGSWDPMQPESWRIFKLDAAGTLAEIDHQHISSVPHVPTKILDSLSTSIDQTIDRLDLSDGSLCLQDDGEIANVTVFGLVESLSGLPYPVPVATKVFGALSLHLEDIDSETRFVALPRMSPASGGERAVDGSPDWVDANENPGPISWPDVKDRVRVVFPWVPPEPPTNGQPFWPDLTIEIELSLASETLSGAAEAARLMDGMNMMIRPPAEEENLLADGDWPAHLPRKLAEAIDPAARMTAVLDDVLSDELRIDPLVRAELKRDISSKDNPSKFLGALDDLAARVIGPRVRFSSDVDGISVTHLMEVVLDESPGFEAQKREANQLLLAHLVDDSLSSLKIGDAGGYGLVTRRRVAQALGLAPETYSELSDVVAVDNAEGLKSFASKHWFGGQQIRLSPPPGVAVTLAGRLFDGMPIGQATIFDWRKLAVLNGALLENGLAFEIELHNDTSSAAILFGPGDVPGSGKVSKEYFRVELRRAAKDAEIKATFGAAEVSLGMPEGRISVAVFNEARGQSLLVAEILAGIGGEPIRLEHRDDRVMRGRFAVALLAGEGGVKSIGPAPASGLLQPALTLTIDAVAAREEMALAFAAPFIPQVLAGRIDWDVPDAQTSNEAALFKRISESVGKLTSRLLAKWIEDCADAGTLPWLKTVLGTLAEEASRNAANLARDAIPPAERQALQQVSPASVPLSIRIDQLRAFAGSSDLWRRLAGAGFLIARAEPGLNPESWYSLNVAALSGRTGADAADDRVAVDPVPLLIGDMAGVRQSVVSYDNRWLVTGLESDAELDSAAMADAVVRRPEVLTSPQPLGARLPALSCGYDYCLVPYLIGHGIVLPVWLRENKENPFVRRGDPTKPFTDGSLAQHGRTVRYLRTRPIGMPLLSPITDGGEVLPALNEALETLAIELPVRHPEVTLQKDVPTYFFRDKGGQRGVLSMGQAAGKTRSGIRLTVNGVKADAKPLSVIFWVRRGDDQISTPLAEIPVLTDRPNVAVEFTGLYSEDTRQYDFAVRRFHAGDTGYIEDRLVFEEIGGEIDGWPITSDAGFGDIFVEFRGDGIEVGAPSAVAIERNIEADNIKKTSKKNNDRVQLGDEFGVVEVGKPVEASEAAHQSRQIVVVHDFANTGNRARFQVRRPSVDFGTFERWINAGMLNGTPAAQAKVKALLNDAFRLIEFEPEPHNKRLANAKLNPAKDFDDPATAGVHMELVEIFPKYAAKRIAASITIAEGLLYSGFQAPEQAKDGVSSFRPLDAGLFVRCEIESIGEKFDAIKRQWIAKGDASLSVGKGQVLVKAVPGCVYELRLSAIVADIQPELTTQACIERMSHPVRGQLRFVTENGKRLMLGPPQVLTIEAATRRMPDAYEESGWAEDRALIEFTGEPDTPRYRALIHLPAGLQGRTAYDKNMRYVRDAALLSQRWDWRGRPQSEIPELRTYIGSEDALKELAETAFFDRRNDDVGPLDLRKIERDHVYAGRRQIQDARPSIKPPALFEKPLDWHGGMNLRRFGLRLTSRYAVLDPGDISKYVRFTHLDSTKQPRWSVLAVPDRPNGRSIARPGLAMVLPLTEPVSSRSATPPLLALFNDVLFANHNIADGIEAVIETSRHPLTELDEVNERFKVLACQLRGEGCEQFQANVPPPVAEKNRTALELEERQLLNRKEYLKSTSGGLKYWQEFGPDPVRTHKGHHGGPVPLRLDGPVGYTFDIDTEAGRFDSASFVLSPATDIEPWSMAKLKFRRFEAPEGLFAPVHPATGFASESEPGTVHYAEVIVDAQQTADVIVSAPWPPPQDGVDTEKTSVAAESPGQSDKAGLGDIEHEGVYLDVVVPAPPTVESDSVSEGRVAFSFDQGKDWPVEIAYRRTPNALTLVFETNLGPAGSAVFSTKMTSETRLRLVVSHHDKPSDDALWAPAGDVVAKLRISDQSDAAALDRPDINKWITVAAIPLLSSPSSKVPSKDPVKVSVRNATVQMLRVRPVRLSPFTPGVWCQFSESMSVFDASLQTLDGQQARQTIAVEDLSAWYLDGPDPTVEITCKLLGNKPQQPGLTLSSPSEVVEGSQFEHVLLAVVTGYTRDIFDKMRERPIAVVQMPPPDKRPADFEGRLLLRLNGPLAVWDDAQARPLALNKTGRVRIIKLLVPKVRSRGGYADDDPMNDFKLEALFARDFEGVDTMNPVDGIGMILGISRPIEITLLPL